MYQKQVRSLSCGFLKDLKVRPFGKCSPNFSSKNHLWPYHERLIKPSSSVQVKEFAFHIIVCHRKGIGLSVLLGCLSHKASLLWYVFQPKLHSNVFSLELTGLLSSEWLQGAGSRSRCLGPDPGPASCRLTFRELNLSVPQFLKMELHYNPPCRTLKRLNGVLYL